MTCLAWRTTSRTRPFSCRDAKGGVRNGARTGRPAQSYCARLRRRLQRSRQVQRARAAERQEQLRGGRRRSTPNPRAAAGRRRVRSCSPAQPLLLRAPRLLELCRARTMSTPRARRAREQLMRRRSDRMETVIILNLGTSASILSKDSLVNRIALFTFSLFFPLDHFFFCREERGRAGQDARSTAERARHAPSPCRRRCWPWQPSATWRRASWGPPGGGRSVAIRRLRRARRQHTFLGAMAAATRGYYNRVRFAICNFRAVTRAWRAITRGPAGRTARSCGPLLVAFSSVGS